MILKDKVFGDVECVVSVEHSAVDSYIEKAYSVSFDYELTEEEVIQLQARHEDKVQMYAYENGSRNHN